ncbi:hypothetical protein K469DRAFT_628263 [Zopfia rhizophila CBS 207.26]|uniref:Uncharacterized protein n=1 Tax=Zopfia rhizophila CBS 207.26 TaxID=1314779 RepID=A0A6A6EA27_9PEZI|nr:hypothetical protein K469DRAFT_628263 [Zopfia rhizophila CBS 207.26]
MSSGGLVPQGNFAQTGTLDWVRLGEGMISFSVKALSRMVNYGVDPFTILLGTQIAQQLPLGPRGERRVGDAISALRSYAGFSNTLLFGFGITSIPQLLGTHTEGLALVAVSAALSEVYHEDVAAKVLNEILLYQDPPRESTPSLQSWSRIVKACAGTFATTSFGKRAEMLMSLHPSETSMFSTGVAEQFDDSWRSRSSTRGIAEALINLGKVSRAELESITIVGGGDAGFLAAVAEWLFDMNIVIVDSNEKLLHFNSEPGSAIHARFVFRDRIHELPSRSIDLEAFRYPRKVVHLKDVSDIIFANDGNDEMLVSGRLEWSHCLSSAFGTAFEKLRGLKSNFGTALGCAARIFEAVAKAEPGIDFDTRKNWIYYTDAGSGHGYVQNLVYWFPELKVVETKIQEAAGFNYLDARNKYESGIAILASLCVCAHCTPTGGEQAPNRYCLVVVMETILKAALILSNVSVEPGLEPKRIGFDRLYQRQIEARSRDDDTRERMEKGLGPIVWVIEPEREDEVLYTVDHRMRLMIDGAMGLFTFLRELGDSSSCAFASGGICAYRKILGGLSIYDDFGCSLGRIHIIPGRVEWHGVAFDRIQDWYQDWSDAFRMEDGRINLDEMDFEDPSLLMEESLEKLSVTYRLSNSRQRILNIPPVYLANNALTAHGLVQCQHQHGCNRGIRAFNKDFDFQVQTFNGKEVSLYRAPNDRSVCAALVIADLLQPNYFVVRDDKCMECALQRAVAEVETANALLIVSYKV